MKVFVAGGTGAIGRPLLERLLANGHSVIALTRSEAKAKELAAQGVEPAIADVFDPDAMKRVMRAAQPEVVIEQLTSLPQTYTGESMRAADAANQRIRLEGGDNVLAAAKAAGVRQLLRQSIAFWAIPGEGLADEETPLALDASPAVASGAAVVAELEKRLLEDRNIEGTILRYGFFYGPETWFHPDGDVGQQVRERKFPIIGNGDGVWSWLHVEDATGATIAAAERGKSGIYLITDDTPLAVRDWLPSFAKWLDALAPPTVSAEEVLQSPGGDDAVYYGTKMRGASNAKAKRELNFQPQPMEWLVGSAACRN